jgi:aminoglycoside 3-N-acetyltransferase
VISEVFRTQPGVVRSLHPTHSVAAYGPKADEIVAGHEVAATPCGAGTPYAKCLEWGCQILLLGVGLSSNTAFHTVEADARLPYLLRESREPFVLIDRFGGEHRREFIRHRSRVPRRFPATESMLLESGTLRRGAVGYSSSLLLEGREFRECLLAKLRDNCELLLDVEKQS